MTHTQDRQNAQTFETKLSKKQRTAAHWRNEMGRHVAMLTGDVRRFFLEYRATKRVVGWLFWATIVQGLGLIGLAVYVFMK